MNLERDSRIRKDSEAEPERQLRQKLLPGQIRALYDFSEYARDHCWEVLNFPSKSDSHRVEFFTEDPDTISYIIQQIKATRVPQKLLVENAAAIIRPFSYVWRGSTRLIDPGAVETQATAVVEFLLGKEMARESQG